LREDGSVRHASIPDALGDPENPLSEAALQQKARLLMASAGIDAQQIETVIAATLALAEGAPLGALHAALP